MNAPLSQPPGTIDGLFLWLQSLWRYVTPECSTSGDANATIPVGSTYHGVTALTTGRTLTLPPTAKLTDGDALVIQDESNTAGSNTITLAASSGDTASGATTISSNRGRRTAIKRGTTWWVA